MERIYLIAMLLFINMLYWFDLSKKWENLSEDGAGWRATIGVIIIIISTIMIFNLGYILNS